MANRGGPGQTNWNHDDEKSRRKTQIMFSKQARQLADQSDNVIPGWVYAAIKNYVKTADYIFKNTTTLYMETDMSSRAHYIWKCNFHSGHRN